MTPGDKGPLLCVTGATGFLGSGIVSQAVGAGLSVKAGSRVHRRPCEAARYVQADVLDPSALALLMEGTDVVIHAAGLVHAHAGPFDEVNVTGTVNAAKAAVAAGARHFILVSTVAVYGGSPVSRDKSEDSGCFPRGAYAESKYLAELRAAEVARGSSMALTILRLATLYGEWDPGKVARLMRAIDHGRFMWVGNGSNRKSLLHRDDAARACLEAARRPASGVHVFNVTGPAYSMREIVTGLAGALNRKVPRFRFPALAAKGLASILSLWPAGRWRGLGDVMWKWLAEDAFDGSQFERVFGFRAEVMLEEGLRREVAWYRKGAERP